MELANALLDGGQLLPKVEERLAQIGRNQIQLNNIKRSRQAERIIAPLLAAKQLSYSLAGSLFLAAWLPLLAARLARA